MSGRRRANPERRTVERQQQLGRVQRRRADHRRPKRRCSRLRGALRAPLRSGPRCRRPVLQLRCRRGRLRRGGVLPGFHRDPDGRRPRRRVPRLPVHRDPPGRPEGCTLRTPHPDHRRPRCARGRVRSRRLYGGSDLRGVRAERGLSGVQVAPRAVAGRALVHRGGAAQRRADRASSRPERQRRRGARVSRPRGPAAGVPPAAPRQSRKRGLHDRQCQARRIRPWRPRQAGDRTGRVPPGGVRRLPCPDSRAW